MNHPLKTVAAGLTAARLGLRLTVYGFGGALLAGVCGFCCLLALRIDHSGGVVVLGVMAVGVLMAASGFVLGVVGRCHCTLAETPPAARAASVLSAVLEVCGWLNGLTTTGVTVAKVYGWLDMPDWALLASGGLSVFSLTAGRLFFLLFCRRLATALRESVARDTATVALQAFAVVVGLGVAGGCLMLFGSVSAAFGGLCFFGAVCFQVYAVACFAVLMWELDSACRRHTFTTDDS